MMPIDRLERQLPAAFADLADERTPDYFVDILGQTARSRQWPAWAFPGRWLPMADITRERVATPGLPWRAIGAALLLLALLAGTLVVIGSQAPKLPAPFGLARNGLVAYSEGGDIYTADPVTGETMAVVTGPEEDLEPRWSLDGTRIAFIREGVDAAAPWQVYVVRSDGSDITLLTPEAFLTVEKLDFSPDGREVLIGGSAISTADGVSTVDRSIFIANSDGSGVRTIDVGMVVYEPVYRPPDGSEIAFVGERPFSGVSGLYVVKTDGTGLRTVVEPKPSSSVGAGLWSPDGSRLVYQTWRHVDDVTARIHVVLADGTGDLVIDPTSVWSTVRAWSNDGTRLVINRGYTGGSEGARVVALPADGSGPGVELRSPGPAWEWAAWAPDDSMILGTPLGEALLPQVIWDPVTGQSRPAPWGATSYPTWQRLAD